MAKKKKITKKTVRTARSSKTKAKKVTRKVGKKTTARAPKRSKNKQQVAPARKTPVVSLLGVAEMREGDSKTVIASVKDSILKNTEDHPFYNNTEAKATVIVSREVEFVDIGSGVYMIPRGTTITVLRGADAGVWSIKRHTD